MLICYCNVICNIIKKIENYALNGFKHCRVVGDVLLLDSGLTYLLTYLLCKTYTPHDVNCSTLHVNSFLISLFGRGVGAE